MTDTLRIQWQALVGPSPSGRGEAITIFIEAAGKPWTKTEAERAKAMIEPLVQRAIVGEH